MKINKICLLVPVIAILFLFSASPMYGTTIPFFGEITWLNSEVSPYVPVSVGDQVNGYVSFEGSLVPPSGLVRINPGRFFYDNGYPDPTFKFGITIGPWTFTELGEESYSPGHGYSGPSAIFSDGKLVGLDCDFLGVSYGDYYITLGMDVDAPGLWGMNIYIPGIFPEAGAIAGSINFSRSPAVPEPGTMLLTSSGIAGLFAFRKKFRKR